MVVVNANCLRLLKPVGQACFKQVLCVNDSNFSQASLKLCQRQGGITCEAIDEPGKSSKAIDKRVLINFRDKNVVIAHFCNKNDVFFTSMTKCHDIS